MTQLWVSLRNSITFRQHDKYLSCLCAFLEEFTIMPTHHPCAAHFWLLILVWCFEISKCAIHHWMRSWDMLHDMNLCLFKFSWSFPSFSSIYSFYFPFKLNRIEKAAERIWTLIYFMIGAWGCILDLMLLQF